MRPNNPACYECPKGKHGLHHWRRNPKTNLAVCSKCKLELNEQDTNDLYMTPHS